MNTPNTPSAEWPLSRGQSQRVKVNPSEKTCFRVFICDPLRLALAAIAVRFLANQ